MFTVLLLSVFISVQALAKENIETGRLTIKFQQESKETVLIVSKVAEITNGKYVLLDEYKKSGLDLNLIRTANDLEEAACVLQNLTKADQKVYMDKSGMVQLNDLSQGVYLISAKDITPFLVSIPSWNEKEGEMEYEVEVYPKKEPLPNWKHSESVETGDNNQVIIYLFLLIMSFFVGKDAYKKYYKK